MKRIFYFLGLALFLVLPLKMSAAGTDVSSNITNPIWTADNSPYVISGVIEVAKGAVLKIEAGTEIRFNPGAKILVKGELNAEGTSANPITMTLNATSTAGVWGGIEFSPESVSATLNNGEYLRGSIIRYAIIKFGRGIKCDDASPYIADNQIMNNTVGLEIVGDNASTGGASLNSTATNFNASLIIPQYVVNNTFTDNTVGILVNRNNGRNFILTPAGYAYIGDKVITTYLENNSLNSNSVGVQILNGDNNILINNTIKYNSVAGLQIAAASRGNILEKNNINNNEIGADIAGSDTFILQNNFKNNFNLGLRLKQRPALFRFSNVYNNVKYNLNNNVFNLDATENFWGSSSEAMIEAKLLNTLMTTGTTTDTTVYPTIYKPFLKAEADITSIIAPLIDPVSTSTIADQIDISGLKPTGTNVVINGNKIPSDVNNPAWSYKADLNLGDNIFNIYYQTAVSRQGTPKTIVIRRENAIEAPTINSLATSTSLAVITISGTKPADTSIVINNTEVVANNSTTTWAYKLPLSLGINALEIVAKSGDQTSVVVSLAITRTKNTVADIIALEKSLSAKKINASLAAKLSGRLLLQVETNGYIWYINPKNNLRYLVSNDSALSIFKALSLGISEANLNLIPTKSSGLKGNTALRNKLKGRFLLRTEKSGQITYVDLNGYRNDISQENLMAIFRSLSLGVSNANLRQIGIGELNIY